MALFNNFPYSNTEEINLDYTLNKLNELYSRGENLYAELQSWKTATDEANEAWKSDLLSDINEWQNSVTHSLEEWKTSVDSEVTNALTTLSNQITDELAQAKADLRSEVADLASAAAASASDAAASQSAAAQSAQTAVNSAAAAAQSAAEIEASTEQIEDNKNDITDLKSAIEQEQGYIDDIATITKNYTQYSKDSTGMTVEVGKKITSGVVGSNANYSYIAYTVQADGYCYCTSTPTDSGLYLYSGEPIGASTFIKGIAKSSFPTANNPLRVLAGQVVAVSAKTTSASQLIYLSDNGTASLPEDVEIDKLAKGSYPISEAASFVIGRWGPDGSHTSTNIARNTEPLTFDHDVVAICDLGYIFYNWLTYDDGSWRVDKENKCAALFKAGKQYRINICKIDESTLTSVDDVISHVKLCDTITSAYNKYKETFFGFDMYNKVAFCGDSYTMRRATYNNCWGQMIGQRLGITVSLFGHSGYTTSSFRTQTGADNSLTGLLAASANDLYWLGFGINDGARYKSDNTYLGSIADISGSYTDYPDTFYGNYGCIIESILDTFPDAKIVLCNVMYHDARVAQIGSESTNIPAINSALIEIANHYSIPLIDLLSDVFYRSPEYQNNMQASAYTHPDPILFPGMASANMRLFSRCVADNPAYFKT